MKKLLSVILAAAAAATMTGAIASAHGGHCGGRYSSSDPQRSYYCTQDCAFTDSDNDGLCDNCAGRGYYCSDGCEYTDEDNDGICDNCNTRSVCSVKSQRVRRGHCHR